jgi:peroxiredoxin
MKTLIRASLILLMASATLAQQSPDSNKQSPADFYKKGHSKHGAAFDEGPREKPWVMDGIGKSHFPITTSNKEVQMWFDQGIALLHSFWYYEAERSFRWALKLDPDCAMAYWGLARAVGDQGRAMPLIKEAAKRKDKVTERERMYIEAWEASFPTDLPKEAGGNETTYEARDRKLKYLLEQIVLKYPDDLEAKALLALQHMGRDNRYGTELILQQVIARDPKHPGAHHYRIHNWDGKDGRQALDSCALYGQIASGIGHAQHMPGHIYSGVGMWHEAAISMDAATRVEKEYMRKRLVFPFDTWNYAHNQNYLSYIQEQLGMAEAAIKGARQVLAAPLDPKYNNPTDYSAHWQGTIALMRALIKFERWKEIVDANNFNWRDNARDKMWKAYCETRGYLGMGDLEKAAKGYATHAGLKSEIEKPDNKYLEQTYTIQSLELKALLALAKGETLTSMSLLADAAKRELEQRERQNDPPTYPNVIYNSLGRAYLAEKSYSLAAAAFEKTLELVRNDGFALSGLAEAYTAMGEKNKAQEAYARLLHVWSDADAGLKWTEQANKLGIKATPKDTSPMAQRNYKRTTLEHLGPNVWEPYEAPELSAQDPAGKTVTLKDYRGKNVLLIFFLGEECPHCMLQLREVAKRHKEIAGLNTEVLAISSDTPQENAESLKSGNIPFQLLTDVKFENARRYKSYDDFEEMALHSTILIDSRGRVHWARTGGDPFMDFDFLTKEIQRMNRMNNQKSNADAPASATPGSSK